MTYCLETTQSHHLHDLSPSCCGIISDIVQQEGGNGRKFPNNLVINLDLAEKILAKKDRRPRKQTMDIAFGCSEKKQYKKSITHITNKCIVLVDFKLNTTSHNFGNKADFEGKVNHSICLLTRDITIYGKYFFIYPNSLKQQAISRIARLFNNRPNCPYTPLTEIELFRYM